MNEIFHFLSVYIVSMDPMSEMIIYVLCLYLSPETPTPRCQARV